MPNLQEMKQAAALGTPRLSVGKEERAVFRSAPAMATRSLRHIGKQPR